MFINVKISSFLIKYIIFLIKYFYKLWEHLEVQQKRMMKK